MQQGMQKTNESSLTQDFARQQFDKQQPALASQSMLAGIDLITPQAINMLSSNPELKDKQVQNLLRLSDSRIRDAERLGLAYSSALWEDILGVRGTGSKRAEAPMEKRVEAKIDDKEAKKVLRSIYDDAIEAYSSASKAAAGAKLSMSAKEFAANALNNAYSEGVANSHTVSQFASNALGNIEKSALAISGLESQAVSSGLGISASAQDYIATHARQEIAGFAQIEVSTAQALVYYFQEHPEDYDEAMVEALALDSPAALSNASILARKIKREQKKMGRWAFSEKLFGILVEKKRKKGVLGKFLSQFGFRVDKGNKTVMICPRARIGAGNLQSIKPLKSMKT
ncbi:MAG: hypothetical protein WC506_01885 [Candidatus Micrarchaeia archaeon]